MASWSVTNYLPNSMIYFLDWSPILIAFVSSSTRLLRLNFSSLNFFMVSSARVCYLSWAMFPYYSLSFCLSDYLTVFSRLSTFILMTASFSIISLFWRLSMPISLYWLAAFVFTEMNFLLKILRFSFFLLISSWKLLICYWYWLIFWSSIVFCCLSY